MTDKSTRGRVPVGIDIGTTTTTGAVVDGTELRLLDIHGEPTFPTRLIISSDGFSVGDSAASDATAVAPLWYADGYEPALGNDTPSSAGTVPLSVFFQELGTAWTDPESDLLGSVTFPVTSDGESHGGEGGAEGEGDPTVDRSAGCDPAGDRSADSGRRRDAYVPGTTTITAPGWASDEEMSRLETAATGAGFTEVRAVRNPVAVAATELPDCADPKIVGVVDIGASWASFSLVTLRGDGTLTVDARTTLAGHGRTEIDESMTEWVLNEIGSSQSATLQYDDPARRAALDATHTALDEVGPDESGHVRCELSDGIEVVDGGWFGSETIDVDVELQLSTCYEVLAEHLRAFQDAVKALFEATDHLPETVDELVVAGDGTRPLPVVHAIERVFEQQSRLPTYGDRYTAPATGAAILSAARKRGIEPITADTYDKAVSVRALDESGLSDRDLTTIGDGPGDDCARDLRPSDETQLDGQFELRFQHRLTGDTVFTNTFSCANLSPDHESPLTVSFGATDARLDADAEPTGRVRVESASDRDDGIRVEASDDASGPWLAHADADIESISAPTRERANAEFVDFRRASERALGSIADSDIVEDIHSIRNKLWERAVKNEEAMAAREIGFLVDEIDDRLLGHGATVIEPEAGSSVDGNRHNILETRATEADEGTILEVTSPGLVIDDVVVDKASVIVSDGTSGGEDQSEPSEE